MDVIVRNEGTVWAFTPQTNEARQWIDDKVQSEPWQWLGDTLVVDHRFGADLVEGMRGEGLVVEAAS